MKSKLVLLLLVSLTIVLTVGVLGASSQSNISGITETEALLPTSANVNVGTGFTYQGRLQDTNGNANGEYDFQFVLYDHQTTGSQISSTLSKDEVLVKDGLFTTYLDFGGAAFNGDARYLEIRVRPGNSSGSYEILPDRQKITAVPLALNIRNPEADIFANSINTQYGLGVLNPNNSGAGVRLDFNNNTPRIRISGSGPGSENGFSIQTKGDNELLNLSSSGDLKAATLELTGKAATVNGYYEAIRLHKTRVEGSEPAIVHYEGGLLFGMHGGNRSFFFADIEGGSFQKYVMTIKANRHVAVHGTTETEDLIANNSIGIGKSPSAALDVLANSTTAGGWYEAIRFSQSSHSAITHPDGGLLFGMHGVNRTFYFADIENGTFQKYMMTLNANNGRVAIGTTNPKAKLHVAGNTILGGDTTVSGTTQTNILQINGGSDLAEPFVVNDAGAVKAGTVVILDPENPGQLRISDQAYDPLVAGVVSGAGGDQSWPDYAARKPPNWRGNPPGCPNWASIR